MEVGISLLVILVGHIDKKINSEMNTGVYILQECWRKWGKLRRGRGDCASWTITTCDAKGGGKRLLLSVISTKKMNVEMKTGVYILNFLEFRGQYKSGLPFNLEPNSGHYIKNLLVKKCSLEYHNTPQIKYLQILSQISISTIFF